MQRRLRELALELDTITRKHAVKRQKGAFSANEIRGAMRNRVPIDKQSALVEPIVYQRNLPRQNSLVPKFSAKPEFKVTLEEAIDGIEGDSASGQLFQIFTRVDDLDSADFFSGTFSEAITRADSTLCDRIAPTFPPDQFTPDRVIFMDIETTGLSSSPLFLIGVMVWEADGFEARQYLARNYGEEAAVISCFVETCAQKQLLITFNGKSFDFPYIRTRAAANGLPFDIEPAHFDILHESRRIWKHALPDCRLQTLERYICNRPRCGDVPGEQIPEIYHEYVRTENAALIAEVLKHNLLDLITMADLMTRFPKL